MHVCRFALARERVHSCQQSTRLHVCVRVSLMFLTVAFIYTGDEEIKHRSFRLRHVIKRSVPSEIFAKGSWRRIMAMGILKCAKRSGSQIRTDSRNNDTKIRQSFVTDAIIIREGMAEKVRRQSQSAEKCTIARNNRRDKANWIELQGKL